MAVTLLCAGRSGQAGQARDCLHRQVVQAGPGQSGAGPALPGQGPPPRGGEGLLSRLLLHKVGDRRKYSSNISTTVNSWNLYNICHHPSLGL